MTDIKDIKTKEEYEQLLNRIDEIFDAEPGTPKGNELDYLVSLIEKYEKENYPIDTPNSSILKPHTPSKSS